jgi:hypothetical protein
MRYLSPGGAYGTTSATDSTTSEEAYSPDAIRQYPAISRLPSMSHHTYSSPEGSFTTDNGSWTTQILYSNASPSSPYAPSDHSACNLKDLQYSHDVDLDEDRPSAASHPPPFLHQPEELAFADEGLGRSIADEDSSEDEDEEPQDYEVDSDYNPSHKRKHSSSSFSSRVVGGRTSPRRTRSLQSQSHSTTVTAPMHSPGHRITKPSSHRRVSSSTSKPHPTTGKPNKRTSSSTKQFPCTFSPYGCPSVFASKNEWKRHVSSQHLQLGFWRCDTGFCIADETGTKGGRGHNDFNRKDLFTQHWRRMHLSEGFKGGKYEDGSKGVKEGFESMMEGVRDRCWVQRREGPTKGKCGVCGKGFDGVGSWEEGMECLGKHFERGEGKEGVEEDERLTEWAIREGVVRDLGERGRWLVGVGLGEEEGDADVEARRAGRRARRAAAGVGEDNGDGEDND